MISDKISRFLATLNGHEQKRFSLFLNSPYFNNDQTLIDLYNQLLQAHFKNKSPEDVWRNISDQPYNYQNYRTAISQLTQLLQQFWAIDSFKQDDVAFNNQLIECLDSKDLQQYVPSRLKLMEVKLDATEKRDASFYLNSYQLSEKRMKVEAERGRRRLQKSLGNALEHIDVFYLISKLRYWCVLLNLKQVLSDEQEIFLMDEIMDHIKRKSYNHIPAIRIYSQILLTLLEEEDESHFTQLNELIKEHIELFSEEEAREMFIFAQNYCLRKVNAGQTNYLRTLLDLYQEAIERGLMLERNKMSPWSFKNIISTALRLDEIEWTEQFILHYSAFLEEDVRENAHNYNLARLHFYKQDFDHVLELLQQVEFNDVFYSLDSRSLLLKTYFELGETSSLDSLVDSFRVFLSRNKLISEHHKLSYRNLIRHTKKLASLLPSDKNKIRKIKKRVDEDTHIADINWLYEKLEKAV